MPTRSSPCEVRGREGRQCPTGNVADQGQGLTEFAIVIPFLIVLFMGVMEFALAIGASLGVNRASQNAAHVAASAGALVGADCLILQSIERDITIPERSRRDHRCRDLAHGACRQRDLCPADVDAHRLDGLPARRRLVGAGPVHADRQRLSGIAALHRPLGLPDADPGAIDGGQHRRPVRYEHHWVTPLQGAMGLIGASSSDSDGWVFEQRNIFRMEPTL